MNRYAWVVVCAFWLLQGCGFEPVYGQKHTQQFGGALPSIVIEVPRDRTSQILKVTLDDRLNPDGQAPVNPDYVLNVALTSVPVPVVIEGNATVRRYNVQVNAFFTLTRMADHKKVLNGSARRVGSYNASRQFFADFVASQDTSERTIEELAADIEMRLHAFFLEEHKDYVAPAPLTPVNRPDINKLTVPALPYHESPK